MTVEGGNASMDGEPVLIVIGDLVALGPQRRDLLPLSLRWLNDVEVAAPLGRELRPLSFDAIVKVFEQAEAAPADVWFTVYERATLRPLGSSGLRDIDHAHGTAEFVIFLGEKACWGRGYGTETARLLLDYAFTALSLSNVMLKAYSFNERGLRAYHRAGFREIGRRRQAHRLAGRSYDVVYMDCLAAEFESPVLGRLLP